MTLNPRYRRVRTLEVRGAEPGTDRPVPGRPSDVIRGRTALELVEAMRDDAPFLAGDSVDEYISNLVDNLAQYHGLVLPRRNCRTTAERADWLIDSLLRVRFLREVS